MKPVTKQDAQEVLDFLQGIPDDKWGTNAETFPYHDNTYSGRHCYLGHVSLNPLSQRVIDQNKKLVIGGSIIGAAQAIYQRSTNKECTLISDNLNVKAFDKLGHSLVEINDDVTNSLGYGINPKERVCNALRELIPLLPDGDDV